MTLRCDEALGSGNSSDSSDFRGLREVEGCEGCGSVERCDEGSDGRVEDRGDGATALSGAGWGPRLDGLVDGDGGASDGMTGGVCGEEYDGGEGCGCIDGLMVSADDGEAQVGF